MSKISYAWWAENKMWLAPFASLIMWTISVLCFVFGLSFKNPMGVQVGSMDLSIAIAFALSLSNTIIQLIGNGQDVEKMDFVFKVGWYSSYVLGIASNINALLTIIGISNPWLEWAVCGALGSMIEIMPEKMIVIWLKGMNKKVEAQQPYRSQQQAQHYPGNPSVRNLNQPRPVSNQNRPTPRSQPQNAGDFWANRQATQNEPTYRPIGMVQHQQAVQHPYNRREEGS